MTQPWIRSHRTQNNKKQNETYHIQFTLLIFAHQTLGLVVLAIERRELRLWLLQHVLIVGRLFFHVRQVFFRLTQSLGQQLRFIASRLQFHQLLWARSHQRAIDADCVGEPRERRIRLQICLHFTLSRFVDAGKRNNGDKSSNPWFIVIHIYEKWYIQKANS